MSWVLRDTLRSRTTFCVNLYAGCVCGYAQTIIITEKEIKRQKQRKKHNIYGLSAFFIFCECSHGFCRRHLLFHSAFLFVVFFFFLVMFGWCVAVVVFITLRQQTYTRGEETSLMNLAGSRCFSHRFYLLFLDFVYMYYLFKLIFIWSCIQTYYYEFYSVYDLRHWTAWESTLRKAKHFLIQWMTDWAHNIIWSKKKQNNILLSCFVIRWLRQLTFGFEFLMWFFVIACRLLPLLLWCSRSLRSNLTVLSFALISSSWAPNERRNEKRIWKKNM